MFMGYSTGSWLSVLQYFIMVTVIFILVSGVSVILSNIIDNNNMGKKIRKKSHFIDIE